MNTHTCVKTSMARQKFFSIIYTKFVLVGVLLNFSVSCFVFMLRAQNLIIHSRARGWSEACGKNLRGYEETNSIEG